MDINNQIRVWHPAHKSEADAMPENLPDFIFEKQLKSTRNAEEQLVGKIIWMQQPERFKKSLLQVHKENEVHCFRHGDPINED